MTMCWILPLDIARWALRVGLWIEMPGSTGLGLLPPLLHAQSARATAATGVNRIVMGIRINLLLIYSLSTGRRSIGWCLK